MSSREGTEKKAAIYIRVSTDAQAEEGYSIDAQTEKLTAYCVAKEIPRYELYIDGGFTGSNLDRPEMKRLIADARAGRLSHVIVYKLDRLSRSQKDTLHLIEDVFNPNGISFISINESMDTATPMGRLMLGILSAFAQLERENIRERTRMGMKERVKSGYWMGGGRIPYGYDYDPAQGILVPNADAENVRQMYRLYREGYSADRIAAMLDLPYPRLVNQILQRKSNAGVIPYNGEEYPGRHAPIISMEEYEATMRLMEERSRKPADSSVHLLTGLLYCGKCGAKMRYQKWGKKGCRLVCYSREKTKDYLVKDPDCDNGRPWAEEIEEIVLQDLFSFSLRQDKEEPAAQPPSPLELLHTQYEGVRTKLKRLYRLYADGDDALDLVIAEQRKKLDQLSRQMAAEEQRQALTKERAAKQEKIQHISQIWDSLTLQEKKTLLKSLIERIIITDDQVEIRYSLF